MSVWKWIVMFVRNLQSRRPMDADAQTQRISLTIIIGCAAQNCICQPQIRPHPLRVAFVQSTNAAHGQTVRKSHAANINPVITNHTALSLLILRLPSTRKSVQWARWERRHSVRLHVRDTKRVSCSLWMELRAILMTIYPAKIGLIKYNNGTTVHPDTIRFNSSIAYNVTCEPIPCSKLRGWSGEFMPNCTYKPFCPDGFPGNYPYCNKYAITTTTLPTVATAPTKTTTPATKTTKSKVLSRLGNKEILNNSIDDNPHNVANNYRI